MTELRSTCSVNVRVHVIFVVLDIRFIHLQYMIGKRELFRQTLGDESFRKDLIDAQRKDAQRSSQE